MTTMTHVSVVREKALELLRAEHAGDLYASSDDPRYREIVSADPEEVEVILAESHRNVDAAAVKLLAQAAVWAADPLRKAARSHAAKERLAVGAQLAEVAPAAEVDTRPRAVISAGTWVPEFIGDEPDVLDDLEACAARLAEFVAQARKLEQDGWNVELRDNNHGSLHFDVAQRFDMVEQALAARAATGIEDAWMTWELPDGSEVEFAPGEAEPQN